MIKNLLEKFDVFLGGIQRKLHWVPSGNMIADLSHIGWGMALTLLFTVAKAHHMWWWGVLIVVAYAAIKEFLFDAFIEAQPYQSNMRDFVCYSIGIVFAVVFYLVAGAL